MKCEKCGKEIDYLLVNVFQKDGSDRYEKYVPAECNQNAVYLDLDSSWTGYDLTEKEQRETILCPYCKTWPFENKEVQQHEIIRVVGFKKENEMTIKELEELKARLQYSLEIGSDCCLLDEDKKAIIQAVDKQIPKKPDYEADGYDETGNLNYDTWICPSCGKKYEVDYDDFGCCPNCGQALDWSDEK